VDKVVSAIKMLDAQQATQLLNGGGALLIDVRESGEFAREHIAGARHVPLSEFDATALPAGRPVILCCASGNRSQTAARRLLAAGHCDIAHLRGGLAAWKAAGLPVEVDCSQPISLLRQMQIVAGSLVAVGTALGVLVSPWFLLLPGFVGAGLVYAGVSETCMMMQLLTKLPYNRARMPATSSVRPS
jgi:rhodanese-related sulfurtransferase